MTDNKRTAKRTAALERELEETYRSVTQLTNELTLAMERLEHSSLHDDLTGLPNRALYHDRLATACALAERGDQCFAVALMGLNRFKEINDTLSHEAGDRVPKVVADRVEARLRRSDTVARIGGDEFAFLLPMSTGPAGAIALADVIVQAVQRPIDIDGSQVDVGASIGLAFCPDHGKDISLLMRLADRAMYGAKRVGGGYHVCSEPDGPCAPNPRVFFAGDLRAAMEHEQLELHYQPKVDMATSEVIGCEALVRWRHPAKGLIMPDDFIPLAERTSLIVPFTLKTITMAVEQLLAWHGGALGWSCRLPSTCRPALCTIEPCPTRSSIFWRRGNCRRIF